MVSMIPIFFSQTKCVDVRYEMDGKEFIAIDTPGLRRSGSVKTNIDFYEDVDLSETESLWEDSLENLELDEDELDEFLNGYEIDNLL